ncbi:hypothetical protein GCM10027418_25020 [Mariniluteicoccus endophyticus]
MKASNSAKAPETSKTPAPKTTEAGKAAETSKSPETSKTGETAKKPDHVKGPDFSAPASNDATVVLPRAPRSEPTKDSRPGAGDAVAGAAAAGAGAAASATSEGTAGEPERPHNPFAELEDDEPPRRRFRPRKNDDEPAGRRAAGRASIFNRQKTPVGRRAVQRRNTASLTIAAIAMLAVIVVIASYVVWDRGQKTPQAGATPTAIPGVSPGPVLTEGMLMTDGQAKQIDPGRTWTTTLTQNSATEQSPGAACIGPQATGQPIPQSTFIRTLTASGNDKTQALHRADAYSSPEEAAQVFNFKANELGGCVGSPLFVERGIQIRGLGNQALGVRVVLLEQSSEYHTIIMARTGRVVDVVDVARFGQPADEQGLGKALAQIVNRQCSAAVGLCTSPDFEVRWSVPPPGGDQPGFLAAGDIPRVTVGQGTWHGNAVASRIDVQDGSGCESIDFNTTAGATTRQQRTYLLKNDPKAPTAFGIDEVVLAMNAGNDANALADRVMQSIESCEQRTLVAKLADNAGRRAIETPGAGGMPIKGRWYTVNVKVDANRTSKYRVAVLSVGQKVIYLRSNPSDTFDFTDDQWISISLRAGERATQAR